MNEPIYIDDELQAWIDPLSPEELAGLEASLLADGCRDPLVVWGGYLLDGHNRYALCLQHGLDYHTVEKTGLVTKEDAKIWMIENQLGKRNTTDFVRVALALKLKPLVEERARARMRAGQADPRQNSDEGPVRTDEALARAARVSRDTVRKVEKIIGKATPEVIAQVRAGELSINAAAKTVTPPKAPAAAPPIPPNSGELDPAPPMLSNSTALEPLPAGELEALRAENAQLRAELGELAEQFEETLLQAEAMRKVLEADAPLQEAFRQLTQAQELNRVLETRLHGLSNEKNEVLRRYKGARHELDSLKRAHA